MAGDKAKGKVRNHRVGRDRSGDRKMEYEKYRGYNVMDSTVVDCVKRNSLEEEGRKLEPVDVFEESRKFRREASAFLASSKTSLEVMKIMEEQDLEDGIKYREGLYSLILPSGSGKTFLSKMHGLIDIDEVVNRDSEVHRELQDMRFKALKSREVNKWQEHNDLWFKLINDAMDGFNFVVTPRVILVHSVECAIMIGARPLAVVLPSKELHRKNISTRTPFQIELAVHNWEFCNAKLGESVPVLDVHTREELGFAVTYMSRHVTAIKRPKEWDRKCGVKRNDIPVGYRQVRHELYTSKIQDYDINTIIAMVENEDLPKCVLDDVFSTMGTIKFNARASGWVADEWLRLNCEIKQTINRYEIAEKVTIDDVISADTDWFKIFPPDSKMLEQRGNVTLRNLFRNLPKDMLTDPYLLEILNSHVNESHHFVVCVITWYFGIVFNAREELRVVVKRSRMLEVCEERWVAVHNKVHKYIRLTRDMNGVALTWAEYTSLQYTAALYGRRHYKIEPEGEIKKRKVLKLGEKKSYKDGEWTTGAYMHDFKESVRDSYRRLYDKMEPYKLRNLADFIRRRYLVATKGSITTTELPREIRGPQDLLLHIDGHVRKVFVENNKKALLEDDEVVSVLIKSIFGNIGYNKSGVAPKPNESAKKRVLIPGSLEHWFVFSYILALAETGGQIGCVDLNMGDATEDEFDKRICDEGWKFMYDFPDHNSHHSAWEMQMVITELGSMYQEDKADLMFCMKWIVESFDRMEIAGERVSSGLYSGWRGTTWINTVLNHCYITCARECFRRLHGYEPLDRYMGVGDDVDSKVKDPKDGYLFFEMMLNMGYEDNEMKQLLTDEQHEFLRVIYVGDTIATCINRTLPAYVCGDLERAGSSEEDKLKSSYVNIYMMRRRGLDDDVVNALEKAAIMRWGRIKVNDTYRNISKYIIHSPTEQGGLGIPDPDGRIWILDRCVPVEVGGDIRVSAVKGDLTRVMLADKVASLIQLGFRPNWSEYDVMERAVSSHDFDSLNRVLATEMTGERADVMCGFKANVLEYQELECETNEMALRAWMASVDTREIKDMKKKVMLYSSLKDFVKYTDGTVAELEEILSDGGENINDAANLTFDIRMRALAPEWVVNSVMDFCRLLIGGNTYSYEEGRYIGHVVLKTYVETFKNVRM
jgi:uncharacterized protein YeeX (DUF496 family)